MAEHPNSNAAQYANFIPDGVRRAAARAEQLAASLHEPAPPPEGDPPEGEAAPTVGDPPEPQPVAPPEPQPVAPPTTDWQQRYRTLQGKYDAEMPQQRAQIDRLSGQIETLQALLAQKDLAPEPKTTTVVEVPDEDVETYGEDLVTATRRWARAEVNGELSELRRQVEQLSTKQVQTEQVGTQQKVLSGLDADPALAGKWRTTNDDPEFLSWLNQEDVFTGKPRMGLLSEAFSRGDVARTGAFFKAYYAEHTAVTPSGQTEPHTQEAGRPSLNDFVAPGRATGPAPAGAPAEKRLWTSRDIQAFYRDRATGKFAGREAESLRLEQDIFAAVAEGRVK